MTQEELLQAAPPLHDQWRPAMIEAHPGASASPLMDVSIQDYVENKHRRRGLQMILVGRIDWETPSGMLAKGGTGQLFSGGRNGTQQARRHRRVRLLGQSHRHPYGERFAGQDVTEQRPTGHKGPFHVGLARHDQLPGDTGAQHQ